MVSNLFVFDGFTFLVIMQSIQCTEGICILCLHQVYFHSFLSISTEDDMCYFKLLTRIVTA